MPRKYDKNKNNVKQVKNKSRKIKKRQRKYKNNFLNNRILRP